MSTCSRCLHDLEHHRYPSCRFAGCNCRDDESWLRRIFIGDYEWVFFAGIGCIGLLVAALIAYIAFVKAPACEAFGREIGAAETYIAPYQGCTAIMPDGTLRKRVRSGG